MKIKKDNEGLYLNLGGYVCRPVYGTMFNEGDEVKAHHFGGSTRVGVTFNESGFNFKYRKENHDFPKFEYWINNLDTTKIWWIGPELLLDENNEKFKRQYGYLIRNDKIEKLIPTNIN